MAKKKEHGFESDEEYYYHEYLLELKELGYIDEIILQPEFNIMPALTVKNDKGKEITIMKKWDYTADFMIKWNHRAWIDQLIISWHHTWTMSSWEVDTRGKHIIQEHGNRVSVVDVKGDFSASKNAGDIRFPLNQKAMMLEHDIYVQKVMPLSKKRNGLFKNSFTPSAYLKTPTGRNRTIKWDVKSAKEYVQSLKPGGSQLRCFPPTVDSRVQA